MLHYIIYCIFTIRYPIAVQTIPVYVLHGSHFVYWIFLKDSFSWVTVLTCPHRHKFHTSFFNCLYFQRKIETTLKKSHSIFHIFDTTQNCTQNCLKKLVLMVFDWITRVWEVCWAKAHVSLSLPQGERNWYHHRGNLNWRWLYTTKGYWVSNSLSSLWPVLHTWLMFLSSPVI